ncbi:hypothetical protein ABH19_04150 [Leptospirillum sp. Group II 'CF-1']|nr:hypothetical protein ABH19_04150 [Leptospirillum sp. Group II 'CF-1']
MNSSQVHLLEADRFYQIRLRNVDPLSLDHFLGPSVPLQGNGAVKAECSGPYRLGRETGSRSESRHFR